MWNTLSVGSLGMPAPSLALTWTFADGALDLALWFAACAVLGVTLSWLRGLARRDADAPAPRLVHAIGPRTGTLARV